MASIIANEFGDASGTWRSALIGLGLVLLIMTVIIGFVARAVLARAGPPHGDHPMTVTTDAAPPPLLSSGQQSVARKLRNHVAATACILATVLIALIPLYFVIAFVVRKGGSTFGWSFLTQDPPIIDQLSGGGMFPAIVGTLVITAGATIMAVPLGILGAIYLNEYGQHSRLARVIRFLSEIMLGVPSIVMGLFICTVITLHFKHEQLHQLLALALSRLQSLIARGDAAPGPRELWQRQHWEQQDASN